MAVHNWTRVDAETLHAFHTAWITPLSEALHGGVLAAGYYAMPEQHAGRMIPDARNQGLYRISRRLGHFRDGATETGFGEPAIPSSRQGLRARKVYNYVQMCKPPQDLAAEPNHPFNFRRRNSASMN